MVSVSCSGKLHAFALAEQLEKAGLLDGLFTSYASQKDRFLQRFAGRVDHENIPAEKIHTRPLLAIPMKLWPGASPTWNNFFDRWVASQMRQSPSRVFIGWSGMSLQALLAAKKRGLVTIIERGSTHIQYQDEILQAEYARFGKSFSIDKGVVKKELAEYQAADYISIPSHFVKKTFLDKGMAEEKLLLNPYGAGGFFRPEPAGDPAGPRPFTIVYLGTLSIRKGLIYLMEALQQLSLPGVDYRVWFIGKVETELEATVEKLRQPHWKFFGALPQAELPALLAHCDIAVQPSLEEGLSMVIPQLMACRVPVILTPNTGGENIVTDGLNGWVVPIRDPKAIATAIESLQADPGRLEKMKSAAAAAIQGGFTWDDYGRRYRDNLLRICPPR